MKFKVLAAAAAVAMLLVTSCSTPKNITYFQDALEGDVVNPLLPLEMKVKPEDKLSIMVNTPDPALSTLFNLLQVQNRLGNSTSGTRGIGTTNTSNGNVSLYTVDPEGNINFPILGKLHIAGMTRYEVGLYIERELIERDLVKDPIVTVEFANTGITVLGEVSSPGRIEFNKDHITIVDAIAMAGDLNVNGKREDILVLREQGDGSQKAYRVNLLDIDALAASPVYYMQQNDVIYVEPNNKIKRQTTATGESPFTPAFWMSIGSFGLTIATLIISLTK
ncbi:MAG: polysaccharide biosynthesis/export family protein [Muribaculaceae bacterium]|nr:polysaccharide biosynthesis/export family protein [Muribaculaceae bacterium]